MKMQKDDTLAPAKNYRRAKGMNSCANCNFIAAVESESGTSITAYFCLRPEGPAFAGHTRHARSLHICDRHRSPTR